MTAEDQKTGIAQYGTKHAHAARKAEAIAAHPRADFRGVFEPDPAQREKLQSHSSYQGVSWYASAAELLADDRVQAVAVEGDNAEGLSMAREVLDAGKHVWLDKPAGDDWDAFKRLVEDARERKLQVQLGYMYRYHPGFVRIAEWARSGFLGDIFAVRSNMSTNIPESTRRAINRFKGGILFELAGHQLDQIVWLLGRPERVTSFLLNHATPAVPGFADNTLCVLEYPRALAYVDIAAMEAKPTARRYEVYGTKGSAIMEPMGGVKHVRLILEEGRDGFAAGEQLVPVESGAREGTFGGEITALIAAIRGEQAPTRSLDHELLVQETLLRATGRLS